MNRRNTNSRILRTLQLAVPAVIVTIAVFGGTISYAADPVKPVSKKTTIKTERKELLGGDIGIPQKKTKSDESKVPIVGNGRIPQKTKKKQ